jgi:hypothetical protein
VGPPDTILEEDHPLTILSTNLCPAVTLSHQDGRHSAVALLLKAALIQVSDYRLLGASCLFTKCISVMFIAVQISWSEGGTTRHNFGTEPSNDYLIKVWFQLSNWFQTRRFLCEFPIGFYVKLSTAVQPSWSEGGTTRHNFGTGPFNDYLIKVWFQLSNWFQTRSIVIESSFDPGE